MERPAHPVTAKRQSPNAIANFSFRFLRLNIDLGGIRTHCVVTSVTLSGFRILFNFSIDHFRTLYLAPVAPKSGARPEMNRSRRRCTGRCRLYRQSLSESHSPLIVVPLAVFTGLSVERLSGLGPSCFDACARQKSDICPAATIGPVVAGELFADPPAPWQADKASNAAAAVGNFGFMAVPLNS